MQDISSRSFFFILNELLSSSTFTLPWRNCWRTCWRHCWSTGGEERTLEPCDTSVSGPQLPPQPQCLRSPGTRCCYFGCQRLLSSRHCLHTCIVTIISAPERWGTRIHMTILSYTCPPPSWSIWNKSFRELEAHQRLVSNYLSLRGGKKGRRVSLLYWRMSPRWSRSGVTLESSEDIALKT